MTITLLKAVMLSATAVIGLSFAGPALAGKWTLIPDYIDPITGGIAQPLDINDSGWLTGQIVDPVTFNATGFLRDPSGVYTTFSVAADTEARGIDNNNRVVGSSFVGTVGTGYNEFSRAADGSVTWLTNPETGLLLNGAVAQGQNAAGAIVGQYRSAPDGVSPPTHGFILNGSSFTDLAFPGADITRARGINDAGVVVGSEQIGGFDSAFIYNNGVWTSFDHPGDVGGTVFEDINNNGLVSGQWTDFNIFGDPILHSFLYDLKTNTTQELIAPGGVDFNQAFGLNNLDQVVDLSSHAWVFNADALPEPGTWALLLVGFGGLGAMVRRRSRASLAV